MSLRDIEGLAVDYDRTLTDPDLRDVPEARAALEAARRAGCRIVVVSGRDLAHLEARFGDLADAIVAENGCVLRALGEVREVVPPRGDLRAALSPVGVPVDYGRVIASADARQERVLMEALEAAGAVRIPVRNRDRVMFLPPGVDKAAGFLAACRALGVSPRRFAAAGDGENDVPLLRAAGYRIAVANAVPDVKAIADHVTDEPGGEGVAAWIRETWL
ncbi:MAG TPA: HAD hydrolase family protein, partial [Candidatus Thermoplasmatota archaeon]|nr:HAD hydrolase family protein [Candidatus Thermoplasmatota archaeon]